VATRSGSPGSARERALDAGVRLWVETPPAQLFSGLNVSKISKAAGITRATFYTYWGTTQEYLDDLTAYVANVEPTGFTPELANAISRLTLGGDHVGEDFLAVCTQVIEDLAEDPALRLRLGMLSKVDDPVVAEKLREQYADLEARMSAMYVPMLERWGRVARPPLEQRHLTVLYTVLMESFAARHRLDPEAAPAELYGWASLAFVLILTSTRDLVRDLPSLAGRMATFATDGDRIRAAEHLHGVSRSAGSEKAPLDALHIVVHTRLLLAYRPWTEITFEELAKDLGTTPEQLIDQFGSKHGLGVAVFQLLAREAFDQLPPDTDPLRRLRKYLTIASSILRRSHALTQSTLLVFAGTADAPATGVITWAATADVTRAVAAAQDAGLLDPNYSAADLTTTLMRTMLTHASPTYRPGWGSEVNVVELVLRGLGAPPPDDPDDADDLSA
jgi:AcrR family transcriptional regulator